MQEGNGFSAKNPGKGLFHCQMTSLAMVQPASSEFFCVLSVGFSWLRVFYDDEVDICIGCNQLECKARVRSQNLIHIYFFTEVLKLILQANPFVKIFIE